jgi:hypothetical protein
MEMRAQEIRRVESGQPDEIGLCGLPHIDDRHPLSVSGVAGDRFIDSHAVRDEMAPGERRVPAFDPPRRERRSQPPVCAVGLGHEKQPRSLLVQPVKEAFPPRAALAGQ